MSLTQLPREITRRLSRDASNAKMTWSESKFVILLGTPPASGTDQMLSTPLSFRLNGSTCHLQPIGTRPTRRTGRQDWHFNLLHLSSSERNNRHPLVRSPPGCISRTTPFSHLEKQSGSGPPKRCRLDRIGIDQVTVQNQRFPGESAMVPLVRAMNKHQSRTVGSTSGLRVKGHP